MSFVVYQARAAYAEMMMPRSRCLAAVIAIDITLFQ
jgi:hypothetical protein